MQSFQEFLASSIVRCNLDAVMCWSLFGVDWRGRVFDCDFNQVLELPLNGGLSISRIDPGALQGESVEKSWIAFLRKLPDMRRGFINKD